MRSQKFWFVCLLLLGLLGGMMGCQSSGGVDEETRAQITALTADLTTVQADIAGLNTRSADLAGQTAAAQGTIEALSAASVAEATVVPEAIPTLEMSLRTALEVIYQDGQPAQCGGDRDCCANAGAGDRKAFAFFGGNEQIKHDVPRRFAEQGLIVENLASAATFAIA